MLSNFFSFAQLILGLLFKLFRQQKVIFVDWCDAFWLILKNHQMFISSSCYSLKSLIQWKSSKIKVKPVVPPWKISELFFYRCHTRVLRHIALLTSRFNQIFKVYFFLYNYKQDSCETLLSACCWCSLLVIIFCHSFQWNANMSWINWFLMKDLCDIEI
jgi:hypothetical protein